MGKGDSTLQTLIVLALIITLGIYASNQLTNNTTTIINYDFTDTVTFAINGSSLNSIDKGVVFDSTTDNFTLNNLSFANNVENKVIEFNNLSNVEINFKTTLSQPFNNSDLINLYLSFNPNVNSTTLKTDGLKINFNAVSSGTHYINYAGVNWIYNLEQLNNNSFDLTLRANLKDNYAFLSLNSINTGFVYEALNTEFVNSLGIQDFSFGIDGLKNSNSTLTINELSLMYN